MNFLILGDGPEERAWAKALADHPDHKAIASFPPHDPEAEGAPIDLDDALAVAGVEAVIVGGGFADRAEGLRRAAAEGLAAVVIHPPGPDSEPYYQVAMSRDETGAVVVPDLPARLHPGIVRLAEAARTGALGEHRGLRYETNAPSPDGAAERDLVRAEFASSVDLVHSILGEIEGVTATGDPAGTAPDLSLIVQLRATGGRRAEVRLTAGPVGPLTVALQGSEASLTLEVPRDLRGPSRLVRRDATGNEEVELLGPWGPREATLRVLDDAIAGRDARPNLLDATRATEVAEGAVRSLRRGRTVDLHYEEISEEATFKGVMTSAGCMVLIAILVVVPVALAGPALGMGWTIYLAYAIPPILFIFLLLQLFRFAAGRPKQRPGG